MAQQGEDTKEQTSFRQKSSKREEFFLAIVFTFQNRYKVDFLLPDHQFYHKWALLTDPDDITGGAKVGEFKNQEIVTFKYI